MRCLLVLSLFLMSCNPPASKSGVSLSPVESLKRGQQIYMSHCIACHSTNPQKEGLGPALSGIRKDVLSDKLLKGTYPKDYTPKRKSSAMVPFPYLEKDLEHLYLFLQKN